MNRRIVFLSSILVLTVLALAPPMQAQPQSNGCGANCPDGCAKCCHDGSCDKCCNGK
jgi:hypothetical protein